MKKLILLLISLFLISGTINSTPPTSEKYLYSVMIDQSNRIWWSWKLASAANLPEFVYMDQLDIDSKIGKFEGNKFLSLLREHSLNNRNVLVISIHPQSHFKTFDNLYTMLKQIELEKNRNNASEYGFELDSLSDMHKFKFSLSIASWKFEENNIIEAACVESGIKNDDIKVVDEEFQFIYKLQDGYWNDKISDSLLRLVKFQMLGLKK